MRRDEENPRGNVHEGMGSSRACMMSATFNTLENVRRIQFNTSGPDYRTVSHGMSFRSKCLNNHCRAYNDTIYISKGFGDFFDIAYQASELRCPACNTRAERSYICGFFMAAWEAEGRLQNDELKTPRGRADTNEYYTFNEGEQYDWVYLHMKVSRL